MYKWAMAMWEVLADGKISILCFVSLCEPGTLRLFNLTNTDHFFGLCLQVFCQAGLP